MCIFCRKWVPFCYLEVHDLPIFSSPASDIASEPALNTNTPHQMQLDPLFPQTDQIHDHEDISSFLKQHHQTSNLLLTPPYYPEVLLQKQGGSN